ncbi:MAG: 50S ribosomal protein L3 [Actinomycetota bacterium]
MAEVKGILGEKVGMTQIFDDTRAIPVTVIKAGPCFITQIKTTATDGYDAVQIGFATPKRTSKPMQGHFDKAGVDATRHLVEVRTDDAADYETGQRISVDIFVPGEKADVVGVSKGRGFAGPMKRHGFSGLKASHGTHRVHRAPGSIGACATPSRVFKGMRMAGHMGHDRVTLLNLEIVQADAERNLLLVKGAVPGPDGGLVLIRSAVKAPAEKKAV